MSYCPSCAELLKMNSALIDEREKLRAENAELKADLEAAEDCLALKEALILEREAAAEARGAKEFLEWLDEDWRRVTDYRTSREQVLELYQCSRQEKE